MTRSSKLRLVLAFLAVVVPAILSAQDEVNETPLGDVARNLRKRTLPSLPAIDDDNFSKVIEQAESERMGTSSLHFVMPAESRSFRVRQADVTCSMSFSANAKSLLSSQYAEMKLPPTEVLKLQGPATLEGRSFSVSITNGTEWHVSEVAVALTVVNKGASMNAGSEAGDASVFPAPDPSQETVFRPRKKADTTMIYRIRAAAGPATNTPFSAPLRVDLNPGDEWHWAIVEAKGYPPRGYSANISQLTADSDQLNASTPIVPPSLTQFESAAATLNRDPQ